MNTIPIPVSDYCNILDNLNSLPGEAGFFFNEYTLEGTAKREFHRNYFSKDNAMHIDAIRSAIREIEESSCFPETIPILLKANLIDAITRVSNTAGTYGSFLKIDDGRKFKQLELTPSTIFDNGRDNQCYCMSAEKIIDEISGNILYLDPPYNERQYPPYYHILETIALGDNPEIYGLTGRRPYQDKKSSFCKKNIAKDSLKSIIIKADFSNIYLSYNTDGIVSIDDLADDLSKDFEVKVFDRSYRRYCSGKSRKLKMPLKEIVLYVKKR